MRTSARKDTSPLTFRDFQEAVSWILLEGFRLENKPNGKVGVWHALPGGRTVTQEILDALEPFSRELRRRLKKPRGWPRGVDLPPWWSDIALSFKITRARASECPECAFPVAVLIGFDGYDAWHCPQCGVHLMPRNGGNTRPAETPT
ncbi:hypothetical protein JCM17478_21850 [Thermopirellula anaerolimosa]